MLLFTSACSLLPDEEKEEVLPTITPPTVSKKPEYEVVREELRAVATMTGKLMSDQEDILFFTLDNKPIKNIYVKNGDSVKKGQVIAELDVDDLQKELRKNRLQLRAEEVKMKETLRKKDEMDPVEFEEAQILFEQKKQELADLQTDIDKATLTAPFTGTIVSLKAKKGAMSKKYDPVVIVADTSRLTVAAQPSKDDLKRITPGMEAEVSINSVDGVIKGKVKALPLPSNDNEGGGEGNQPEQDRIDKYMTIEVEKMPKGVTRGTMLSVTVVTNKIKDAIVIPPSALRTIGSRTYVQVADENGKREVDVEVGMQTPTKIEIKAGLEPGQKVVGR
ncbi:membrane-fusion protein [Paenibacillus popilliae ATCC 14706]|uniref:Membrane-fusion protein n=2 Tax=Paenibacillus popilliae TaxID=78057 RepID=M9LIG8_PAEPP|nr:membrane-fusion protein [Paenibacillus popilliae ATCC 14706]